MNKQEIGTLGENAAVNYLRTKGYHILARKYRSKAGEIDIIAEAGGSIAFIEVKTRRNNFYGTPAEAVTYLKQRKIITTALNYLSKNYKKDLPAFRFDVLEIFINFDGQIRFNHITNAFGR